MLELGSRDVGFALVMVHESFFVSYVVLPNAMLLVNKSKIRNNDIFSNVIILVRGSRAGDTMYLS